MQHDPGAAKSPVRVERRMTIAIGAMCFSHALKPAEKSMESAPCITACRSLLTRIKIATHTGVHWME